MAENTSLADELTGVQADHGGLTLGDLIVLLFDLVLLVYTGWRSFDFLSTTVPDGWQILALVGLWGLDIGAVGWSLVWIFGSSTRYQDWVSMAFFVIDLGGVVLTSLTDSLMYGKPSEMSAMLSGVAMVFIPLIIVANVVAGFIYHLTSPATQRRRTERKIRSEFERKMNDVWRMNLDLQYAERYLLAKQDALEKSQLLAEIKRQQDALELQVRARLEDRIGVNLAAKNDGNNLWLS